MTRAQSAAVLLAVVGVILTVAVAGTHADDREHGLGQVALAIVLPLFIAAIAWTIWERTRKNLLPDLVPSFLPPTTSILQLEDAQFGVVLTQRDAQFEIKVVAQNCFDTENDFRLTFVAESGPGFVSPSVPELRTTIPSGGVIAVTTLVPLLLPSAGFRDKVAFRVDGASRACPPKRQLRFTARPYINRPLPPALTVLALIFSKHLITGRGSYITAYVYPCPSEPRVTYPEATWQLVHLSRPTPEELSSDATRL